MELRISKLWLIILLIFSQNIMAGWDPEVELISSGWGSEDNKFGIRSGDVRDFDILPGDFQISTDGHILMADNPNRRVKVFKPDLSLLSVIEVDTKGIVAKDLISPFFWGDMVAVNIDKLYLYSVTGELLYIRDPIDFVFDVKNINGETFVHIKTPSFIPENIDAWFKGSDDGGLLSPVDPLVAELTVKTRFVVHNGKKIYFDSLKMGEKIVNIKNLDRAACKYELFNGYYYCVQNHVGNVRKLNQCGNIVGEMLLPSPVEKIVSPAKDGLGVPDEISIELQYLTLKVIGHDIYATKRTSEGYSLVKWIWEDEEAPNAGPSRPFWPRVKAHDSYVDILWKLAIQDPGCVTEYKIFRTDTEENIEKQIDSVPAGVEVYRDTTIEAGKEYTYRLKASSGLGDSEFSESVTVTVPQ